MIRTRFLLAALCLFVFIGPLSAQQDRVDLSFGVKGGGIYSRISNLETTIMSEPYYTNYSLSPKAREGFTLGGFVEYNPNASRFAVGADILYSQQGGDLVFNNSAKDFYYNMHFKYQYVNILPQIKFYPWPGSKYDDVLYGFNVAIGLQVGLNVAADDITYKSGGPGYLPAFGSDLEQQQQLRNVLKGKTNFGPSLGLGYKNVWGWSLEGRVYIGVTDVVETQANSYNFIENKNTNFAAQLTLSYDFALLGKQR